VYSKHDNEAWDKIGEATQFFGNWEDPPANTASLTWYEILKIPPKKGNTYTILSDQYVAAWLNTQKDVDPANPTVLGTAMADTEALLMFYSNDNPSYNMFPPTIPVGANHFTSDDRAWAMQLASLLDQFNSGMLAGGPQYCDEHVAGYNQ
jgi:hypothetical protein